MGVFHFTERFNLLKPLEARWEDIRDEYLAVANQGQSWHEAGLHNGLWETVGLFQFDRWLQAAEACPLTTSLLKTIPNLFLAGFSVLKPRCQIRPHVGYSPEVWRSHLGLICPSGAWIEVAGCRHHWKEGQAVVFDDTQRHQAANESDQTRVVLIADFLK